MILAKDHISVCICTYKRPQLLARLLNKLEYQRADGLFIFSVVIVDNDALESGRAAVLRSKAKSNYEINYDVEPERSISLARNRTIKNAKGNLIAFIDDDEFPDNVWLVNHYKTLVETKADGVLGPVKPHFDGKSPGWLEKSGLLTRPRLKTGDVIRNSLYTRTGNVLLRKRLFEEEGELFDPAYGRSGGGDTIFFERMMNKGKTFVWCNKACVYETVVPERQRAMYYIKRALSRGLVSARRTPVLSISTLKSLLAITIYTTALPICMVIGFHLFMKYLVKNCDHIGKILGYFGIKPVIDRPYQ